MIKQRRINTRCASNGNLLRWYSNGWHHYYFKSDLENFITSGQLFKSIGYNSLSLGYDGLTKNEANAIKGILNAKYIDIYSSDGWNPCTIESQTWDLGRNDINGACVSFSISTWSKVGSYSPVYEIVEPDEKYRITYLGDNRITFDNNIRKTV